VQPILALALGLRGAGYDVTFATHTNFEGFVRSHGLEYAPMSGDPNGFQQTPAGRELIAAGANPLRFFPALKKVMKELGGAMLADALAATAQADAIVAGPLAFVAAPIAQKRGLPVVRTALQPTYPTPSVASPMSPPGLRLGRTYNLLTYRLSSALFLTYVRPMLREWRAALGLTGRFSLTDWIPPHRPGLYGFSPALFPPDVDWGANAYATGFWFLDAEPGWTPPPELEAFLAAGPPPVYIGFGSMNDKDPEGTTRIILEALERTGLRAVIGMGWAGLAKGALPAGVYAIDSVPHDWLFPRVAAVVHHAGAGTMAAGLRAGKPTVCIPFATDQPFWAHRLHELGVSPPPIPRKQLAADRLAAALREATTSPVLAAQADRLGQAIRGERGVETAVGLITKFLEGHRTCRSHGSMGVL
jgi:UDP:flavonoid glycosyltransferase YjiC (YdhE family)